MAFLSKLKDRLFKSSSRLEEGLDAIVEAGGSPDTAPDTPPGRPSEPAAPTPDATPDVPPREVPGTQPPTTPEPPAETPPSAPPETPAPDLPEPEVPQVDPGRPDVPSPVLPDPGPDELPDDTPDSVPPPQPGPTPTPEPTPIPTPEPDTIPPPQPDIVPPPGPGGGTITAQPPARATPQPAAPPPSARTSEAPVARASTKGADGGILSRLFGRSPAAAPVVRRVLDDDMLEQLEELLIASDMGVDTALRVASNMAEGRMGRRLSTQEIKDLLSQEIARIMEPVARPLPIFPKTPQVVLVVGVNGSGKTTTIGKLASQFRAAGKSVIIAAGDTFRAAAVEQLEIWGERAGVPVLKAAEGSDPAALAFDALQRAEAEGVDLLMIDTAGRLQNRQDLMEELAKIIRVLRKKDPSAPHNTLLVLDATTGQNALSQVETFQKMADVSGLVMTKLDGTAKGGVLVALADKFGLPIHAIGVGEQIDDLAPFDPDDFARALTGADS